MFSGRTGAFNRPTTWFQGRDAQTRVFWHLSRLSDGIACLSRFCFRHSLGLSRAESGQKKPRFHVALVKSDGLCRRRFRIRIAGVRPSTRVENLPDFSAFIPAFHGLLWHAVHLMEGMLGIKNGFRHCVVVFHHNFFLCQSVVEAGSSPVVAIGNREQTFQQRHRTLVRNPRQGQGHDWRESHLRLNSSPSNDAIY